MSHRKVHSHGSIVIPFSWEHSPGISKTTHQNQERRSPSPPALSPSPISPPHHGPRELAEQRWDKRHGMKPLRTSSGSYEGNFEIPPPPGMGAAAAAAPRRIASLRGFLWREEDPFLAAYKECTKSASLVESGGGEDKKSSRVLSRLRSKGMSIFSCKSSCDVRENSFVRLSRLPALRETGA